MNPLETSLHAAHPSWGEVLRQGIAAVNLHSPGYIDHLFANRFLPENGQMFAAFSQPLDQVAFVLVGEGPYPRAESANGYCFIDAAVESLWSSEVGGGLSKPVNRATSLRNFLKMLLVAEQYISFDELNPQSIANFSANAKAHPQQFIQTMKQLQDNFLQQGFLLLNASPVFRDEVAPVKDARAWQPFLDVVMQALANRANQSETVCLILWGKIADRLRELDVLRSSPVFQLVQAEHPYNLSFISNSTMHALFRPLRLLSLNR